MLNEYTLKQLQSVQVADLSNYDQQSQTVLIPRSTSIPIEVGKTYLVEIDPNLCKYDANSLIVINWNRNTVPPTNFLIIKATNKLGDMVGVESQAYDISKNVAMNIYWGGWLPVVKVKVIKEII